MDATLSKTRLGFIETAGGLCQKVGMPRSTGQIYGLLYLSSTPLPLEEIAALLSISKASASTGSRQLLGWQAIRQVWVPGDRRDFFEARGELRDVLRAGYDNLMRPKLDKSARKLEGFVDTLESERTEGTISREEYEFCRARLRQLEKIQNRLRQVLPLAEQFL
jgi:HTH-type transcriptional regulator, glycine betaine synthesis regulator